MAAGPDGCLPVLGYLHLPPITPHPCCKSCSWKVYWLCANVAEVFFSCSQTVLLEEHSLGVAFFLLTPPQIMLYFSS